MKKQYRKKATQRVLAVQLNLETDGFTYEKWGSTQVCKQGDWLVENNGETYTIDQQTFADTYRESEPGFYEKTSTVWAEVASEAGVVKTKEGSTEYEAGDYLVCNDETGEDRYAVSRSRFESMYEVVSD